MQQQAPEIQKILPRNAIATEDCWNVEALYNNISAWESDLSSVSNEHTLSWKTFLEWKGKLHLGVHNVKECLDSYFSLSRHLSKIFTYAHLRHDEDVAEEVSKIAFEKALSLMHLFSEKSSWLRPELLSQSEKYLQECLSSTSLKEYRVFLEAIVRLKPHTLSSEQEEILSLSGQALDSPRKIFSAFLNADLTFPPVLDKDGTKHELTLGSYQRMLKSTDRILRKNAFDTLHKNFQSYENTLCEALASHVQTHFFEAKARKFSSCLEAALFPYQIDTSVYHNLIHTVHERLGALHRYMGLRKKLLKVDALHCYDLYVPLIQQVDFSMSYKEAEKTVIEATAFLGKEFQKQLEEGLVKSRWVDRYENQRKRSGAYSSGCYDSMPYILMNYQGTLNDVFTLCHEAGHSMHSLLSNKHQPYQYADYPIFVAEVASTFLEEVLMRHLIKDAKTLRHKAFLINQKIEDIRATLFRQCLFAEFELAIHTFIEQGMPLTPDLLKKKYRDLYSLYYGSDLIIDDEIVSEWSRIPHFYSNFYVYQYATGISAALSLVSKVENEGERARNNYLQFLSSGSSQFPLDLLKIAGVDMQEKKPISDAIDYFEKLTAELEETLNMLDGSQLLEQTK